jgi:hypothetical protein
MLKIKFHVLLISFTVLISAVPAQAATFAVTNINDSGAGSLRQAILDSEASAGADTINVSVTGTVGLQSDLPTITQSLTINGGSQTSFIVSGQNINDLRPFAVNAVSSAAVNINNLTVTRGGGGTGGGIFIQGGANVTLANVTVSNNNSAGAGGIRVSGSTLNIVNSLITGNRTTFQPGGGISASNSTVFITGTRISQNMAAGDINTNGGGLYSSSSNTRIENSVINGNSAESSGGGLRQAGGTLLMSNVSIVSNSISGTGNGGGGLHISGSATLRNLTFQFNSTTTVTGLAGGMVVTGSGTVVGLANSIITQSINTNPSRDVSVGNGATLTLLTNNIITSGITNNGGTINNPQNALTVDAQLIGLTDNGGQVPTIAFRETSPARDAGTNGEALDTSGAPLTTDARGAGFPRISNQTVDLGAFEYQAPPTAASVSIGGRVLTVDGRGIGRAIITLTDMNGNTRRALTNPFGYYRFDGVAAGATYVIQVRHKSYDFAPQVLSVAKEMNNLNFTAAQ